MAGLMVMLAAFLVFVSRSASSPPDVLWVHPEPRMNGGLHRISASREVSRTDTRFSFDLADPRGFVGQRRQHVVVVASWWDGVAQLFGSRATTKHVYQVDTCRGARGCAGEGCPIRLVRCDGDSER